MSVESSFDTAREQHRNLILSVALSTATSQDLCSFDSSTIISPESKITWAQALAEPLRTFASPSYLWPHIGGALQPWVITVIVLVLHLLVVIIRVVRWENAQTLCLVSSLFTIIVVAQACPSTQFQSFKVLTWTPLLLVIDAGSMAHILFLVIEEFGILKAYRPNTSSKTLSHQPKDLKQLKDPTTRESISISPH